jgi:hypothetical protein
MRGSTTLHALSRLCPDVLFGGSDVVHLEKLQPLNCCEDVQLDALLQQVLDYEVSVGIAFTRRDFAAPHCMSRHGAGMRAVVALQT